MFAFFFFFFFVFGLPADERKSLFISLPIRHTALVTNVKYFRLSSMIELFRDDYKLSKQKLSFVRNDFDQATNKSNDNVAKAPKSTNPFTSAISAPIDRYARACALATQNSHEMYCENRTKMRDFPLNLMANHFCFRAKTVHCFSSHISIVIKRNISSSFQIGFWGHRHKYSRAPSQATTAYNFAESKD